jgi:hypothetical protein
MRIQIDYHEDPKNKNPLFPLLFNLKAITYKKVNKVKDEYVDVELEATTPQRINKIR